MVTRVAHLTTVCDYAACEKAGTHVAEQWVFCLPHLRAHHDLMGTTCTVVTLEQERRDDKIAELHAIGFTDAEIARQLVINPKTVANARKARNLPVNYNAARSDCGGRHKSWWSAEAKDCSGCAELRRATDRKRWAKRQDKAA